MRKEIDLLLVRAGFVLLTIAFLTGFAIPAFLNPRMAAGGHLSAILNALILIVLGITWSVFAFGPTQAKLTRLAFLYAAFASWVASSLAAAWGTSRATPIAGEGFTAAPWQETLVQGIQVSIVLMVTAGSFSVLYGLRSRSDAKRLNP